MHGKNNSFICFAKEKIMDKGEKKIHNVENRFFHLIMFFLSISLVSSVEEQQQLRKIRWTTQEKERKKELPQQQQAAQQEEMKDLRFSGSGFSPLILYWILVFSFEHERALLFLSLCAPLPFVKETKAKKMIMMRKKERIKKEITLTTTLIPLCGSFAGMLSVGVDSRYWYFLLLIRAERKISLFFSIISSDHRNSMWIDQSS